MDNFILLNKIGEGAYSNVFKAKDKIKLNYLVIKKMELKLLDKRQINTIFNEIYFLKNFSKHQNIINFIDFFEDNNYISIFLEYFCDINLNQFIKCTNYSLIIIKKIMMQLSSVLKYLFKFHIFHRDLKTHNILINSSYNIKLIDFNYSHKFSNIKELNKIICGTPYYMAPEIICQKKYYINSDLWSFGIILYELLYKKTPFSYTTDLLYLSKEINKILSFPNFIVHIDLKFNTKFFSNEQISIDCKDLLSSLLKKSKQRISWENFFKHKFLKKEKNIFFNLNDSFFNSSLEIQPINYDNYYNHKTFDNFNEDNFNHKTFYNFNEDNFTKKDLNLFDFKNIIYESISIVSGTIDFFINALL